MLLAAGGNNDNTAHLKGKLNKLNEEAHRLQEECNFHKKEVNILRSEKETLQNVLTMKCKDTNKAMTNELHRVVEEIKRHYANQTGESTRLQQQLTQLSTEKTNIQKEIVKLQGRLQELNIQIGHDEEA